MKKRVYAMIVIPMVLAGIIAIVLLGRSREITTKKDNFILATEKDENLTRTINEYIIALNQNSDNAGYYIDYKSFSNAKVFGTKSIGENELEVYAWVMEESFYKEEEKVIVAAGSSIPHKFIIETIGGEYQILDYQIPRDGNLYSEDMKEIFPLGVRTAFDGIYDESGNNILADALREQVKEYYGVSEIFFY
jgi:hypothetical protein